MRASSCVSSSYSAVWNWKRRPDLPLCRMIELGGLARADRPTSLNILKHFGQPLLPDSIPSSSAHSVQLLVVEEPGSLEVWSAASWAVVCVADDTCLLGLHRRCRNTDSCQLLLAHTLPCIRLLDHSIHDRSFHSQLWGSRLTPFLHRVCSGQRLDRIVWACLRFRELCSRNSIAYIC